MTDDTPDKKEAPSKPPQGGSDPSPNPANEPAHAPAKTAPSGSPIDKNKVMADALQAIVKRADQAAGVDPASVGSTPATEGTAGSSTADTKPEERKHRRKRKKSSGANPATADPSTPAAGDPSTGHGPPGPSVRSKRKKKKGGTSAVASANDAVHSLASMVRNLLDAQKVPFLRRPRFMELNLRVPLDARLDGPRCATRLVDQVLKLVAEVQKNEDALVPGSVYSYFSDSAEAEGCCPEEPRQVFDGYGSTGRPKFTDFVTMAIERKAQGIDALLSGEDITLTHVCQGRVLRTAQLAEFGKSSPVYRILGQVDAGLFAVRGQEAKAAFSFQVLLGKDLDGKPVLRLHPVGKCDVMNLVDHSVAQILHRFQGDLDEAALRLAGLQKNGDSPDEEEFVLPMLQDLAKQLGDRQRHRSRRTQHAERRVEKSQRPTNKAYHDAEHVADADLLWDDKENTVVIVGEHGRVHVFTAEAKHITSVSMNRGMVQQRLKSHRWRHTEPSERGEFRMQLRAKVKNHREHDEKKKRNAGKQPQPKTDSSHLQSKIAQLLPGVIAASDASAPPASSSPDSSSPDSAQPESSPPESATPAPEPAAHAAIGTPSPAAESTPTESTTSAESTPAESTAAELTGDEPTSAESNVGESTVAESTPAGSTAAGASNPPQEQAATEVPQPDPDSAPVPDGAKEDTKDSAEST